jgi:hypothetical protein
MLSKYPRNEPCPCGSGKKYKRCCIDKGFEWTQTSQGVTTKRLHITDEARSAIDKQKEAFMNKFGREPSGDDPLFFDPNSPEPMPLTEDSVAEMMEQFAVAAVAAGISADLVYATKKTGMMVTEDNYDQWSNKDLREWEAALQEYRDMNSSNGEDSSDK